MRCGNTCPCVAAIRAHALQQYVYKALRLDWPTEVRRRKQISREAKNFPRRKIPAKKNSREARLSWPGGPQAKRNFRLKKPFENRYGSKFDFFDRP
jgi:hypothetical protein